MNAKDLAYAAARGSNPPTGVSTALKALCLVRSGRWNQAHELCKADLEDPLLAKVHAHLHRVKGESEKADYWRKQGGETSEVKELGEEWMKLAEELIALENIK